MQELIPPHKWAVELTFEIFTYSLGAFLTGENVVYMVKYHKRDFDYVGEG